MLGRELTAKLSWRVALAAVALLLVVAVYFDGFLRSSFQSATDERVRHAAQRVLFHFQSLEADLAQGVQGVVDDQRLVASIQLINKYEQSGAYQRFLIDEEKKILAQTLLDQLKASLHTDMALYDAAGDLVAFAVRRDGGFLRGYRTEREGVPKLLVQGDNEPSERPLVSLADLDAHHVRPAEMSPLSPLRQVTHHRVGDAVSVKVHQNLRLGATVIGQVELSRRVGPELMRELSSQLGVELSLGFEAPPSDIPVVAHASGQTLASLQATERDSRYVAVLQREVIGGTAYLTIQLDRSIHQGLVQANRWRFLLLLAVLSGAMLLWMRRTARIHLTEPLGALMAQIGEVEQGHYRAASPRIATGDELEQISQSVSRLASAVAEREASLERARHEQEHLSNHDALTALPNRRYFAQRLEHALDLARRRKSTLAVVFMDLDQFKLVNDTQGHDVGDELLIQVARRLQATLRVGDTLARIGGDEFNLLLEDVTGVQEVEAVVLKLMRTLREPFVLAGQAIETTISMGVALYPRDGTDSVALLKHADLAVYKTKSSGRNGYSFYAEELSRRAHERSDTIAALSAALDDPLQFHLVYQPKCDAQSGRMVSAEALIRWNRPGVGLVSPAQFIPLAEETGQIVPIGDWVIERVCRDLASLREQGIVLNHVSLNVSNVQLRAHPLADVLLAATQRHGLKPNWIELEITESYIAQDTAQAIDSLHRFRELGFQLAIDDFGTGYSSMSYLQKLPFTRLKIDQSFVSGLPGNEDSVAIVRAIVGLAKSFGLRLTAEGVETQAQWDHLRAAGCSEIQGYVYARPMRLPELVAFHDARLAALQMLGRV